jgi:hypothetical protein
MLHFISFRLSCAWRASIHPLARILLASEIALHFQSRYMGQAETESVQARLSDSEDWAIIVDNR